MDLFRMKCFTEVARYRSISKAAKQMNMTQPAMSVQIKELEREVGFPIVVREKRGVALTASGSILNDGFRQILKLYDSVLTSAKLNYNQDLRLSIGFHGPLGWARLNLLIARFTKKFPDVVVTVFHQQWRELAMSVDMGILDIAFLVTDEVQNFSNIESTPLFREKACFAISPLNKLSKKELLTPEDIMGETVLMNNHPSVSMDNINEMLILSGIPRKKFRYFDEMEVALSMAAACQGIVALPRSFKTTNDALVYVDYDSDKVVINHCLAWNRNIKKDVIGQFISECSRFHFQ